MRWEKGRGTKVKEYKNLFKVFNYSQIISKFTFLRQLILHFQIAYMEFNLTLDEN